GGSWLRSFEGHIANNPYVLWRLCVLWANRPLLGGVVRWIRRRHVVLPSQFQISCCASRGRSAGGGGLQAGDTGYRAGVVRRFRESRAAIRGSGPNHALSLLVELP